MPAQPTTSMNGDTLRAATPAQRRAAHERIVSTSRTSFARRGATASVITARDALLQAARQFREIALAMADFEVRKVQLEVLNPTIAYQGTVHTLRGQVSGPLKALAVITIDICLLSGLALYLMSTVQAVSETPPWWYAAPVIVALIIIELAIAIKIEDAHRTASHGAGRARAMAYRAAAAALLLVVSAMGAITLLTDMTSDNEPLTTAKIGMIAALAVMAGVCHSLMLSDASGTINGLAQLVYRPQIAWLTSEIRACERRSRRVQDRARDFLNGYEASIGTYRAEFGEHPPTYALIQARDAEIINAAVGEQVVQQVVGGERPEADAGATPDTPPADEAVNQHDAADAPPPARADIDYAQQMQAARARELDGEITP